MRLTIQIDDDLHRGLKEAARREGLTLSEMIDRLLSMSLDSQEQPGDDVAAFRQPTFHMGQPLVNLDKSLEVVDSLNDEDHLREQNLSE